MNDQHHVVEKLEIERLHKQIKLMSQLANYSGFFDYYYNVALVNCKTRKAAYEQTNDLYINFFNQSRYSDYKTFRRAYNHFLHKKPIE